MTLQEMLQRLAEPFPVDEVGFRIQSYSKDKTRGMVITYIDARSVASRLDEVVGVWEDSYRELPSAKGTLAVECSLTVYFEDRKITRVDTGTASAEDRDAHKAAYSDAFKRAAVKFGVGRYLYALPKTWVRVEGGRIPDSELDRLKKEYQKWISGMNAAQAAQEAVAHITALLIEAQKSGKGEQALALLAESGWTPQAGLQKSREVYKALRELVPAVKKVA